jgi:hypothetical protein
VLNKTESFGINAAQDGMNLSDHGGDNRTLGMQNGIGRRQGYVLPRIFSAFANGLSVGNTPNTTILGAS